jgi:phosphotransferase system HPr (HPr) family protein
VSTSGTEPSTNGPQRRTVVVKNPQGLHVRPAAAFAGLAARFESRVTVSKGDGEKVDGKFWPDLLLLMAEQGTPLELEVDGPDAPGAIEVLAKALAEFHEDEAPVQPAN